MRSRYAWNSLAVFGCQMVLTGGVVLAQAGAAADAAPPAIDPPAGLQGESAGPSKGALADEYVDASFGFALRPLDGSTMDRRKRQVENRLQLVQFVRLDIGWSLAVRWMTHERPIDVQAAEEALEFDLAVQYPDSRVTRAEPAKVAARDAVRLTGAFSADGQIWLRQQVVLAFRPKEYLLIILTTPDDDREVAARAFEQILESFKILRTQLQEKQIEAALDRGMLLGQDVASGKRPITERVLEPIQLRLSRDGHPVGVVDIQERVDRIGGKEGVRSLQQVWLFSPDQSVQYLQEDKFVSADFTYDEWRNVSQIMPSKEVDPRQRVLVHVEAGIRRGDKLVVKYAGPGVEEKDRNIETEPNYGPTSLPLLLPRIADLSRPELYAFSMYDTERRGMTLRTFRVVGPGQATVDGRRVSGYKIEDSEGLLPPVNEMLVTETGRLIRLASGPVEMTVSSPEQLELEFGERIRATQKQFRQNAGLPEPTAQQRAAPAPAGSGGSRTPARTPARAPSRARDRR